MWRIQSRRPAHVVAAVCPSAHVAAAVCPSAHVAAAAVSVTARSCCAPPAAHTRATGLAVRCFSVDTATASISALPTQTEALSSAPPVALSAARRPRRSRSKPAPALPPLPPSELTYIPRPLLACPENVRLLRLTTIDCIKRLQKLRTEVDASSALDQVAKADADQARRFAAVQAGLVADYQTNDSSETGLNWRQPSGDLQGRVEVAMNNLIHCLRIEMETARNQNHSSASSKFVFTGASVEDPCLRSYHVSSVVELIRRAEVPHAAVWLWREYLCRMEVRAERSLDNLVDAWETWMRECKTTRESSSAAGSGVTAFLASAAPPMPLHFTKLPAFYPLLLPRSMTILIRCLAHAGDLHAANEVHQCWQRTHSKLDSIRARMQQIEVQYGTSGSLNAAEVPLSALPAFVATIPSFAPEYSLELYGAMMLACARAKPVPDVSRAQELLTAFFASPAAASSTAASSLGEVDASTQRAHDYMKSCMLDVLTNAGAWRRSSEMLLMLESITAKEVTMVLSACNRTATSKSKSMDSSVTQEENEGGDEEARAEAVRCALSLIHCIEAEVAARGHRGASASPVSKWHGVVPDAMYYAQVLRTLSLAGDFDSLLSLFDSISSARAPGAPTTPLTAQMVEVLIDSVADAIGREQIQLKGIKVRGARDTTSLSQPITTRGDEMFISTLQHDVSQQGDDTAAASAAPRKQKHRSVALLVQLARSRLSSACSAPHNIQRTERIESALLRIYAECGRTALLELISPPSVAAAATAATSVERDSIDAQQKVFASTDPDKALFELIQAPWVALCASPSSGGRPSRASCMSMLKALGSVGRMRGPMEQDKLLAFHKAMMGQKAGWAKPPGQVQAQGQSGEMSEKPKTTDGNNRVSTAPSAPPLPLPPAVGGCNKSVRILLRHIIHLLEQQHGELNSLILSRDIAARSFSSSQFDGAGEQADKRRHQMSTADARVKSRTQDYLTKSDQLQFLAHETIIALAGGTNHVPISPNTVLLYLQVMAQARRPDKVFKCIAYMQQGSWLLANDEPTSANRGRFPPPRLQAALSNMSAVDVRVCNIALSACALAKDYATGMAVWQRLRPVKKVTQPVKIYPFENTEKNANNESAPATSSFTSAPTLTTSVVKLASPESNVSAPDSAQESESVTVLADSDSWFHLVHLLISCNRPLIEMDTTFSTLVRRVGQNPTLRPSLRMWESWVAAAHLRVQASPWRASMMIFFYRQLLQSELQWPELGERQAGGSSPLVSVLSARSLAYIWRGACITPQLGASHPISMLLEERIRAKDIREATTHPKKRAALIRRTILLPRRLQQAAMRAAKNRQAAKPFTSVKRRL